MSACCQSLMSSCFSSIFPVSHRTSQSLPSSLLPHQSSFSCSSSTSGRTVSCSLTGLQETSAEPLQTKMEAFQFPGVKEMGDGRNGQEDDDEGGEVGISKINVPRQKHIPVSKCELRDAIVSVMFQPHDQDEVNQFLLLSSCLDALLHAEHKCILEEMRSDYYVTQSVENDESTIQNSAGSEDQVMANDKESEVISNGVFKVDQERPLAFNYGLDLKSLLNYLEKDSSRYSYDRSRVAVATRFQRAFMKLLSDAQFEELSARDLMLTSALNTDYLLTLPIYVDWERAYKSNAIIFRRGFSTERQKGLLIVEKIDYLQSRLLLGIFTAMSRPLGKLGSWINEAHGRRTQLCKMGKNFSVLSVITYQFLQWQLSTDAIQKLEAHIWTKRSINWLKELSAFQKSRNSESISDYQLGADQLSDKDLPIWLAAQRAVARYEGILSPVGPRGRLLRKLLSWIGLISPRPETPVEPESDTTAAESHLRPISLSRISLSDIWRPASRKHCGNNFWKMFKTSISIFLSQSILQEPAFEELILLYTEEMDEANQEKTPVVPSLQLKIYERIPIPDLPVIFPHKKLSFRIIDTVRLDAATILGLLAYFINYKFEDVLSSPSAIFLDVVAVTALVVYGTRIVLGYKQTWDRYQLLVNKTLYEKTLASGFGTVHFLLDASEQQQYKEAILAYAVLLKADKPQVTCKQSLKDECERFMYDAFKVKVEMRIDEAINTLIRLRLVTETGMDGRNRLQAVPCAKACVVLKEQWSNLLD